MRGPRREGLPFIEASSLVYIVYLYSTPEMPQLRQCAHKTEALPCLLRRMLPRAGCRCWSSLLVLHVTVLNHCSAVFLLFVSLATLPANMFFDVHVLVRTPAYMPFAPLACNSTNNTPIPSAAVQLVSRRLPAHSLDSDETPHRTCPSPAPSLPRLAHPNPPEPALNRTPSLTLS